ncbi:hypothetical protein BDZ97DRAFT_842218 [Flammula alnicola]|nr:hypothetical protein BDZ97DRAFT_842218 [Flammula alnicola]
MPLKVLKGRTVITIVIIIHACALSTSCFRLLHRLRIRRLWWDDFWAFVAIISDIILFSIFLSVPMRFSYTPNPPPLFYATRWVTLLTFTTSLWTARLTVAVTIVRLLPDGPMRKTSKYVSIIFGMFWMTLAIQKVFFCGKRWRDVPFCSIPRYTAILELVTDLLADLWLLLSPAYIFWRMKLRRAHHRLILAIFACGIFTALASITHSVFILLDSSPWVGLSGHIEVAIAIVVSNLLVLVTFIYRVFRRDSNNSHRSSTSVSTTTGDAQTDANPVITVNNSSAQSPLTTVELTELSHLGSTFEISTASYVSTPCSSFFYPTNIRSVAEMVRSGELEEQ